MNKSSTDRVLNKALTRLYPEHTAQQKIEIKDRFLAFSERLRQMESNDNPFAKNPNSSAAGLYQFIDGSLPPAQNRMKRYDSNFPILPHITNYNRDQQEALAFANLLQQKGTDTYFNKIGLQGDREAEKNLYAKYHHTNPDLATLERMGKIFNL